jgi:hypothetical protein
VRQGREAWRALWCCYRSMTGYPPGSLADGLWEDISGAMPRLPLAIKHGLADSKQGGTLRIAAHIAGRELILEVINSRPAGAAAETAPEGVGLRNSSQRLRLLFGPVAQLRLDLSEASQATAEVRIPI